ncbi:MAG: cyclase family protein [Nitrospinota bacterium]
MTDSGTERRGIRCVDLSVPVHNFSMERDSAHIFYWNHREGARRVSRAQNFDPDQLPDGIAAAAEEVTLHTHTGTHLDAPWHYGPTCGGLPSRTVDEIPLEWCFSDGVVLDLTHKGPGELITADDLKEAVRKIGYQIKPYDIALIRTDAIKHYEKPDFLACQPGMGRESTLWLLDQGVKIVGIDAWTLDRPLAEMAKDFRAGDREAYWAAHLVGREREYCQIEKLANLDLLPKPFGFRVSVFPVKVAQASAGWVRAVAIFEEE